MMKMKKSVLMALTCGVACAMVSMAACAPKQAVVDDQASEGKTVPVVEVSWSPDGDCVVCHDAQGSTMASIPCAAAGSRDMECSACHTDQAGLAVVHEGVTTEDKTPKRLKQTTVSSEACESCHDGLDVLATETVDSTVLTDSKGTVVNPHDLPVNDRHETMVCGDCHAMHDSGDVRETAPKACSSCHHTGVYECGTCHEIR